MTNGMKRAPATVPEQDAAYLLRHTSLFRDLDDDTVQRLAEISVTRSFRKGQIIFEQGDPADALYVVVEGEVKVHVDSGAGDEMVLVTLRPPDVFGELALVDGGPRSASAEALVQSTLLSLNRRTFLALLEGNPEIAELLLRALGRILRRLTEQASDLVFLDLHGRVAKLLIAFAGERGEEIEGGIALDLGVTQTDLAAMVGGSRQSVNQILRLFERRGYVDLDGRRVVVKKADLLRKRAGL